MNDRESGYSYYDSNMSFDIIGTDDSARKEPSYFMGSKNSQIERTLLNNEKFSQELSRGRLSTF
jgi:hypothetical protein